MGCASSLFTPYTKEETDAELAKLLPVLPLGELMAGGMIKVRGANGFFNPNSLLDPSWLKGNFTPTDYRDAINYINVQTAYTQIGLNKLCRPADLIIREQMRTAAGLAAVEELNKRYTSVKFTYQATAETTQLNMSYTTDPTIQFMERRRPVIANVSVTLLYIAFQ